MSGEFAWVPQTNSYAYAAIERLIDAMEKDAEYPATRVFIDFMDKLSEVMRDIAWVEAGDASYSTNDLYTIEIAIRALQAYRASVEESIAKIKAQS